MAALVCRRRRDAQAMRGIGCSKGTVATHPVFGFQENPAALYRAADVAVLASTSESLSNFLIEAHAHGLPSIAYEVTGVHECGGIVVPRDNRDAFLAQVSRFITDRETLKAESRRVRSHALEHFSPQRQTAAYLDLFARLCTSESSP